MNFHKLGGGKMLCWNFFWRGGWVIQVIFWPDY